MPTGYTAKKWPRNVLDIKTIRLVYIYIYLALVESILFYGTITQSAP